MSNGREDTELSPRTLGARIVPIEVDLSRRTDELH